MQNAIQSMFALLRHGSQIRLQLSAASPTNRPPEPKVIITIVIIKLKLWPAAGSEAKVVAELSSRPLFSYQFSFLLHLQINGISVFWN